MYECKRKPNSKFFLFHCYHSFLKDAYRKKCFVLITISKIVLIVVNCSSLFQQKMTSFGNVGNSQSRKNNHG